MGQWLVVFEGGLSDLMSIQRTATLNDIVNSRAKGL